MNRYKKLALGALGAALLVTPLVSRASDYPTEDEYTGYNGYARYHRHNTMHSDHSGRYIHRGPRNCCYYLDEEYLQDRYEERYNEEDQKDEAEYREHPTHRNSRHNHPRGGYSGYGRHHRGYNL